MDQQGSSMCDFIERDSKELITKLITIDSSCGISKDIELQGTIGL